MLERYQRRTSRLTGQIRAVVCELAGRAGARTLSAPAVRLSRHTALRILLRLPLPQPQVPRVLGVNDFALRRRHRYATVLINAETRRRIDVVADRTTDTLETWLHSPGLRAHAARLIRACPAGDR
ncbi:transposase [Streptosporangium lutulentum]|uniref:Transposase n=1 Tax=Streptosporangium lutulentum TaxID=1461250 RepID=A0ABT9Q414_9ACTN|nr:transposase [Streptosporangium lutulentum]